MPSYATATEVQNKTLARQASESSWADPDIDERIDMAEAAINACLAAIGYDVAAFIAGTAPPLVKQITIELSRGLCFRDLFTGFSPSRTSGDGFQPYIDRANEILEKLKTRELELVDAVGSVVVVSATRENITFNTADTIRAMTMKDSEDEILSTSRYYNEDVTGDDVNSALEDC